MSSSRTTAAQRRRNGPPDLQGQGQGQRGPGTSIQSTTAFSQPPQIRPGTNGRLAGQQASVAQQQNQQQQQQQQNVPNSKPKMSVPQAITLITLRLGRLENQMQSLDSLEQGGGVNNELIEHIIQRLDTLEQKTLENENAKQQLDLIKPVIANTKTLTTNSSKEIKDLKLTIEHLKKEMNSLQNIVSCLQSLMTSGENETSNPYNNETENNNNNEIELNVDNVNDEEDTDFVTSDNTAVNVDLTNISLKEIIQNDF